MNRSARYSKISTLNQLRNERARLESDITNKELLLNLQFRDITEHFSIANMVSLFLSQINSLTPFLTWVQSAFNFFRTLFKSDDNTTAKPKTKQQRKKPGKATKKGQQSEITQSNEKRSRAPAKRSTKKSGKNK